MTKKQEQPRDTAHDFDPVHLGDVPTGEGGIALAVITMADGRQQALFMPRSVAKLNEPAKQAAADLQRAVGAIQELQSEVAELVAEIRAEGGSWEAISWCVGTTANAALKRWGEA